MKLLNNKVLNNINKIKEDFLAKKPFKYTVIEEFFDSELAEKIYQSYPEIDLDNKSWDGTTYLDQRNKFTKTKFTKNSILNNVFSSLNSSDFLEKIETITSIDELIGDPDLFGGGLHQSVKGAVLNVHIDYNLHPETKLHRRCNLIIFMNKNWKDKYEGHLELWDFVNHKNGKRIEKISPVFNRAVIFETNEISFHGHPHKLNTPDGINRKSIATYYYTKTRPENEVASEHNTVYKNVNGLNGGINRFKNGLKALFERIRK